MKFSTILVAAAVVLTGSAHATDDIVSLGSASMNAKTTDAVVKMTATAALEAAQKIELPTGIKLTGTTDPIRMPAFKSKEAKEITDDANHEQFLGGWGGWGGFGPYRFGYTCGGLGGWAYPLGYWNTFGAGLWGGGCGLGLAYGGLFYC